MSLRKRYAAKTSKTLVSVLEQPEDFSKEAYAVAEEELFSRELSEDHIHELAMEVNREKILKILRSYNVFEEELHIPSSRFLSKSEHHELVKEAFDQVFSDRDAFGFDVMQYTIGAVV